jgi:long-chain acyl-CoA synthetase
METLPDRPQQPLHEYLRTHARERGDRAACIWYGHAMSWSELDRASDAFAARLQAIGVAKGEPVVLFLNNCPQYLVAHFGIQKIGAIVCPSGPLNKEHELAYQVNDLKARVIVAAAPLLPVVRKVQPESALAHVFVVHYADLLPAPAALDLPAELAAEQKAQRNVPADCEDFLAVMKSGAKPEPVAIDMDDVALMTYTSGTTGLPKGAMLSYGNALFKTRAVVDCNGVRPDDVLLSIAPLYHIAGMLMGVNVPVLGGATSVLLHRFDPRAVLQAIATYKVSWWYSIAPMNVACMQVPDIAGFDLTSLKMNPVTSFGITFTEPLAAQWRSHAGNCTSFEAAYGLSETHTCDTYTPHHAPRWGTQGIAVPGVAIRIVDADTGADMPTGEVGEIVLTSPGTFKGYWNKPEATAATLAQRLGAHGRHGQARCRRLPHLHRPLQGNDQGLGLQRVPGRGRDHPHQASRGGAGRGDRAARRREGRGREGVHRAQARCRARSRRTHRLVARQHGELQGAARRELHRRIAHHRRRQGAAPVAERQDLKGFACSPKS